MESHYCRLAFWYHLHVEDLLKRPSRLNRMMSSHLPELIDEYFLSFQAAAHGGYVPQSEALAPSPEDKAEAKLDALRRRAQPMLDKVKTMIR